MGFGPLRVINEDRVAPGAGFPSHGHANMEILSYVLDGALAHRDDAGGGGELAPGALQWMSAGHGVTHSEFNASGSAEVHFLQVWIQPDRVNAAPAWASRDFPLDARRGRWVLLASPDGADGSLAIRQDARLQGALLEAGGAVEHALAPGRRYWLHLARGRAAVEGPGGPLDPFDLSKDWARSDDDQVRPDPVGRADEGLGGVALLVVGADADLLAPVPPGDRRLPHPDPIPTPARPRDDGDGRQPRRIRAASSAPPGAR